MTINFVLRFITRNDAKTTIKKLVKFMNKPDAEEDVRACAVNIRTLALVIVGKSLCSSPITYGPEFQQYETIAHYHQPVWPFNMARIVTNAPSCSIIHVRNFGWGFSEVLVGKWRLCYPCRMHSTWDRYLRKRCKSQLCVMFADALSSIQSCK